MGVNPVFSSAMFKAPVSHGEMDHRIIPIGYTIKFSGFHECLGSGQSKRLLTELTYAANSSFPTRGCPNVTTIGSFSKRR